ncbi:hypothetical protein TNCV_3276731 [Trichonephila clavipes]|nr:hypothetical protein TNCV_3276731 [Trichonephila clavipes]
MVVKLAKFVAVANLVTKNDANLALSSRFRTFALNRHYNPREPFEKDPLASQVFKLVYSSTISRRIQKIPNSPKMVAYMVTKVVNLDAKNTNLALSQRFRQVPIESSL